MIRAALKSLLLLGFVLLAGSISSATDWKVAEVEKDGVVHLMNPDIPRDGIETIQLEERWRLGGESEDEGEFFGVISSVIVGEDGNVYLLDRQLTEVKVFSSDGEYLRTIGREGEGPGEFRRPSEIFFSPEGNVCVLQTRPGKIVVLTPEGDPTGEIGLPELEGGGQRMMFAGRSAGSGIAILSSTMARQETKAKRTVTLATYTASGEEIARFHEAESELSFASPVVDERENLRPVWDAGSDGRVYAVPIFGEYHIDVWSADGKTHRVIERQYAHLKRTSDEIQAAKDRIVIRGPFQPEILVAEYDPDIRTMFARSDGSLWVLTSRGVKDRPEGSLGVFDLFDPDGRFIRQVVLMGEGDPEEDLYFLAGEHLFVVTSYREAMRSMFAGRRQSGAEEPEEISDDLTPMEVICYSVGDE